MVILFCNLCMLFIFIVFNLILFLLVGVFLGYLGIELEAGVSIVFVVIFGIVVDDLIYFFSKFKLVCMKGLGVEEVIYIIFWEIGKVIIFISIIFFFGFLVMLFSIYFLSVIIGLFISLILFSVVVVDLFLFLLFICWLMKNDQGQVISQKS